MGPKIIKYDYSSRNKGVGIYNVDNQYTKNTTMNKKQNKQQ